MSRRASGLNSRIPAGHFISRSRITITFALLTVLALGASCGLPAIPFLEAPQNPDFVPGNSPENRVLTFEHNPANDGDDFEGYDLYYKLYTQDQTELIESDANFIETTPRQPGPSRLVTRGFVRAVAVREQEFSDPQTFTTLTSDRPPHIPTEPTGSSIEYQLDLQSPLDAAPTEDVFVSWSQGGERRRGFRRRSAGDDEFPADPTELKSFWNREAYTSNATTNDGNWDLERMNLSGQFESGVPDRLSIVWYVLSYGIDGTSFAGYYSEPLRLDSAELVLRTP